MKREAFEAFVRRRGLQPLEKVQMPECDIYLADGFKNDNPKEYPWGYFETVWATSRGHLDVAQPLFFDAFHDPGYPDQKTKQRMRLNKARKQAIAFASINKDTGRYDA